MSTENKIETLNETTILRYIKDKGTYCLHCGSEDIKTSRYVIDYKGNATATVFCEECGKYWLNVYKYEMKLVNAIK